MGDSRSKTPKSSRLGCWLEIVASLLIFYAILWVIGPGVDLYLPPRSPCGGGLELAKMKRTVADLRNMGLAWSAWRADQDPDVELEEPPTVDLKDYRSIRWEELFRKLHPRDDFFYMQEVPETDGWNNAYEFYYRGPIDAPTSLLMRSAGCDGEFEASFYESSAFGSREYDRDIVWADGRFLRWPGS